MCELLPPAAYTSFFSVPELVLAYVCHSDMMSRELGNDPIEFRRRNLLRDGRPQATGTLMRDAAIEKVLDRLAVLLEWNRPFDRGTGALRRGRGIAIGFKACVSPTTSLAAVNVNGDGSCIVYCSTVDMGQGSDTAMAQIAGEVLSLPAESVRGVHSETAVRPYDMATLGSRSLFHMGNAVKLAAEDALKKLNQLKSELQMPPDAAIPEIFKKKYGMQAGNVVGTGSCIPSYPPPGYATGLTGDATPFWMVGGSGVEIEVDTETGRVRVARLVNVA